MATERSEQHGLRIGDAVQVHGGFAWIVTRLADMDGRFEVTTPDGRRENVLRDDIMFVERCKLLDG